MSTCPPLGTKFTLGPSITPEQKAYLGEHGYLHFEGVLTPAEVELVRSEVDRVESQWLAEGRTSVNGIPLFFGARTDGSKGIQRFAFTSLFSEKIGQLVRDARFVPVRSLVGTDVRVGEREKDGVVVNRFLNVPGSVTPRLGWHTDGLRDLFYLRMPQQMLNVGLHLDECPAENGGLRLLPGTHRQGFLSMCFRKPYFVWHRPDPEELVVETKPGDLTVHDGRLWHRVAQSERTGPASLRRSMYVPYLTGPYEPKSEASTTPAYHRLGAAIRLLKRKAALALAVVAVFALMLISKNALAAGYWNFDKGVSNFGRGGANIAAPSDPIAVYTNPAALSGLSGFRIVLDADAAWDDRRFERSPDRLAQPRSSTRNYDAVENDWPELPPSPGFFASWNAKAIGAPGLTIGAGLYGPPRADTRFPADGPQRYQLIESHNLQIHRALAAGYELPFGNTKARLGVTLMSIDQVIRTRLAFNTFMGMAEDPGWDADMRVKARDSNNITAAFGGSICPFSRLTLAASGQLPYDVKAKGHVHGKIGEALEEKAELHEGGVTVKTKLPGIARGAVRWDEPRWNVEGAFVYETWGRNDEVLFLPKQPGGLGLEDEDLGLTMRIREVRVKTHLRDTWSVRLGGERALDDKLTVRSGVFYERAAVDPEYLSASAFDLDKVGVAAGTHMPLPKGVWLDFAAGWEWWKPVESRESRIRLVDPIAKETRWRAGNGRYSNSRGVAMIGLGIAL